MKLRGVFVGIDNYQDRRIKKLKYAVNDASKLYQGFQQSLDPEDIDLVLLTDENATRRNIARRIGDILARQAEPDDFVLIYFAGHGTPETFAEVDEVSRYFVTFDTDYQEIFSSSIDLERDMVRFMNRISSKLVVVILDTCFSGRAGGRTFEGPHLSLLRKDWREGLRLSTLDLGEGRVMLCACDDDQVAYEYPQLKHGVFTYYLLSSLSKPYSNENTISLSILYDKVSEQVLDYTGRRQTPLLNGRVRNVRLPLLKNQ